MTTSVDIGAKAVELLQHPARRRAVLRRLPGAAHLPHIPQDDGRAQPPALHPAAGLPAAAHPRGLRLARPAGTGRQRTRDPLPRHPGDTGRPARHPGRHLPQGPEPDPGTGHADPAGAGADQQRELAVPQCRREGRRLRIAAGAQRPGREDRRGAVFHAAPADPGHGGRDAPRPRRLHLRPGLRHRRLPASGPTITSSTATRPWTVASGSGCSGTPCTAGRSWTARRGCAP